MAYRLTSPDKWKDPWFRKLKASEKLVFLYLLDNCDLAGFYELDYEMMTFVIGLPKDRVLGAVRGLNRGILEANGWVWVKNFLRHQKNLPLNTNNNAHLHIIRLFKDRCSLFKDLSEYHLIHPYVGGLISLPGKDKDIDKGKGKDKGKKESTVKKKIDRPKDVQEVISYFHEKGYSTEGAKKAYEYYQLNNWHDAEGKPVLAWKQKVWVNWMKPEYKTTQEKLIKVNVNRT